MTKCQKVYGDHYGNALYWSQLHAWEEKARGVSAEGGGVAVLITGYLKVRDGLHLQQILEATEGGCALMSSRYQGP